MNPPPIMFEARFQSFVNESEPGASAGRLRELRTELVRNGLTAYLVPRADRYQKFRHMGAFVESGDKGAANEGNPGGGE